MMVAMFKCIKCANQFESEVDVSGVSGGLAQIRKCPVCGKAGTAGVWQSYPIGTLRVIKEKKPKSK